MLLVIDVGNTESVFGLYEGEKLITQWRMSSKHYRTADECWILLKSWLVNEGFSMEDIHGMAVSSVVPSLSVILRTMARKRLTLEPLIISAEMDTGMKVVYDAPREVGADRICNAVAGFARYGGPLIIVDFGTATTFDVVSAGGEYLGGMIALGLHGASQELHRLAAKLPRVEMAFPHSVVGKTTEESMQSGIMWGTVCLIDGMVDKVCRELKWDDVRVVATGGVADVVCERSERIQSVDAFLTLEGIRLIYNRCK